MVAQRCGVILDSVTTSALLAAGCAPESKEAQDDS